LSDYDIIIVGAGPAGSTAALYAKRQGLKTLLIDKARFPRDKICGDAISGKSVAVLHELGLVDAVRALPGAPVDHILFGSPDHTGASIPLDRHPLCDQLTGNTLPMEGFVIRREVFDHFLFEQASAVCDQCIEEFSVEELVWEGRQVVGIRGIKADGQMRAYSAPLVLGCDGYRSIVARKAGLYQHESQHWMVALRQYWQGVEGLRGQIELHFIDEVKPGYFWIFPTDDGRANIGIGLGHDEIKKRGINLKTMLKAAIDSPAFRTRFANAQPLEEPVGWNLPVSSKRRTIHGNGFLLLGDAASLIDPFTGEGIGNAFYSARAAITTAVEARTANDYSARFLRRYEEQLWQVLGSEFKLSTQLHALGNWGFIMNLVVRKAARSPHVSNLICGMMANAVPRKQIINPLFYLRLLFS
jgi:menaquinone-9 beta-reductase